MTVSIPFKRESTSKPEESYIPIVGVYKFQFPSNGKLLPNEMKNIETYKGVVNQFQFPSNGKLLPNMGDLFESGIAAIGFNSLQTGNSYQTEIMMKEGVRGTTFQFPSNGKLLPNN